MANQLPWEMHSNMGNIIYVTESLFSLVLSRLTQKPFSCFITCSNFQTYRTDCFDGKKFYLGSKIPKSFVYFLSFFPVFLFTYPLDNLCLNRLTSDWPFPLGAGMSEGEGQGGQLPPPHCVFKWILRGHLKPTPNAIISNMFEVISIKFW